MLLNYHRYKFRKLIGFPIQPAAHSDVLIFQIPGTNCLNAARQSRGDSLHATNLRKPQQKRYLFLKEC
jgi:hypothetical protein